MTDATLLCGGRVVTPDRVIEDGWLRMAGDRITGVGPGPPPDAPGRTVDVEGRVVMPGLVDLHGDDIEGQLRPRAEARVDPASALVAADRVNVLAGVTTKFHAIAFEEDADGLRDPSTAAGICREIAAAEGTMGDNRVHARCELTPAAVAAVESLAADVPVEVVSAMRHVPGGGQFDEGQFREHYASNRDCPTSTVERLATERAATPATAVQRRLERVAGLAAREGIPLASHDDETPAGVDRMAAAGVEISEYPVTMAAARRATERGLTTAMGAPNLVRGGSLWGNLSVRSAVDAGVVDVLCSDYHPPSLLAAAFVDTGEGLAERVRRVTAAPADAAGLADRGRLRAGARADVLVVEPGRVPTVEAVFVGGEQPLCVD